MAPSPSTTITLEEAETQARAIIQTLYNLIVQSLDHAGSTTQTAMRREVTSLITTLIALRRTSANLRLDVPQEVVQYVESGRNPDIYTREFVELVQKENQLQKGKMEALLAFQAVLAENIQGAVPEMRGEVRRVMARTEGLRGRFAGGGLAANGNS